MAQQSRTNIWIDGSQAGSTLQELKKSVNALNREIQQLPRNSDAYKKKMMELKDANSALTQHRNQIKGVGDSYGSAKNSIGGMIKQFAPMAGAVGIVTSAVGLATSAVTSWYNNNKEMEKSLSSLRSLTGASAEDIEFYKETAKEMGKTTTLSATQAVEAFKLIGSARPDLLKNKEALAQVTQEAITLAEAAEMDLGEAAQALAGTMNQFNLGAEHSTRIINALAAGSKEGAAEISEVSQSMDKFGAVASSNNVTVEESVALIELLSEKNIKGAEAGTQLRNVLLNVATASALPDEAQRAMEQYGVNLEIVQNKALPLEQRLREMAKVQGDQNALVKIFGKENVVAGQTVLKNVDHFAQLTDAVTGTNTAYEQQAINNDNLDGDLKKLGSAWEGLTLSMDGGSSMFRGVVQDGADLLNWVGDTITAFKEWNTVDMETQFLKLMNVLPGTSLFFGDLIEDQIRLNEITSSVIEQVKTEGDQMVILTESLMKNNDALKNKNITDEEAARIQKENEEIIGVLNEKYPELTKNMDLNKISSSEMNELQKELNKTIIEQAVNTAKAAEQQRLLEEIIANTIKQQRLQQEESKRSAASNFILDFFTESSGNVKEEVEKSQRYLKNLDKDFKEIGKTVNGMDLQLGAEFKANGELAAKAIKDLEKLVKRYEKETNGAVKKGLEAQIKGLQETAKIGNKEQQKALDGVLGSFDDIKEAEKEAAVEAEKAAERKKEANKKAADAYKKLQDQLQDLINKSKEFAEDFNYKKRLDAFVDAQEKELFALQHSIDEKYEKEIASAQELSKKKGKIGTQATEELNALLALKEEELNHERAKINEKYQKEKQDAEYEAQKEANLKWIAQQESLEKALVETKVAGAIAAVDAVAEEDIKGRKKAMDALKVALLEQAEYEKQQKLSALMGLRAEETINDQEYFLRKEELERTHRENIEKINADSDEKIMAARKQRAEETMNQIAEVANVISQFMDVMYQERINQAEQAKNKEISAIEEQYTAGIISKEQYEEQKARIEAESDGKRKQIENDKARKDKEMAIFNAIIETAIAVLKATPNPFLMALATATGIAQIGLISATPVPQYAEGGFHNVIGAKDGKLYNAKNLGKHPGGMLPSSPSLVLASEHGPEYFVPNHLLQNQQVLNSVRVIEAIRTNQYAEGGFTSPMNVAEGSMSDKRLLQVMEANYAMLVALNSKLPYIQAVIPDKTVDDLNTRTAELNQLRN